MTNITIAVSGKSSGKLSRRALSCFLRWGFLPAPLHLDSGLRAANVYSDFPADASSASSARGLQEFAGHRDGTDSDADTAVRRFSNLLCEEVERSTQGNRHIYLMASGGKDSLSIAWALREVGKTATLIHCRDFVRDDESFATRQAAKDLGHDYVEIDTQIHDIDSLLADRIDKFVLPIADAAFFPYLAAVAKVEKLHRAAPGSEGPAMILDGMGNDAYMGHIPSKREKRLLMLPTVGLNESFISLFYSLNVVHYGLEMLERRPYERHFSGVGFSVKGLDHRILDDIFAKYSSTPELRRGLIRGAIFDLDCCIRKGVIAAGVSESTVISYPYLSSKLRNFFDTLSPSIKFDYPAGINKLILRRHLREKGIKSEYASSKKGSFRCDLSRLPEVYRPSEKLRELLQAMSIGDGVVDRLYSSARENFVSSQKLATLYILDRYLTAYGLHELDDCGDETPLRHTVAS